MVISREWPSTQLGYVTTEMANIVSKLSHMPEELLKVPEQIASEDIARVNKALTELLEVSKNLWIKTGIPAEVFKKAQAELGSHLQSWRPSIIG